MAYKRKQVATILFTCLFIIAIVWSGYFARSMVSKSQIIHKIVHKAKSVKDKVFAQRQPDQLTSVTITADLKGTARRYKRFWGGVGTDSFNEGILAPENAQAFRMMAELNNGDNRAFNYVRACGMYAERLSAAKKDIGAHVYSENLNGRAIYNWEITDKVFDRILKNGFIPIVQLTYMPDQLASDPTRLNPWNRANVSPPKDYNKWRNLVNATVEHLKNRYGVEEINKWYFEVWNEPDLPDFFWIRHPNQKKYPKRGYNTEYFKLYDFAVEGAISAAPTIRIGGPALAGDVELFLDEFLEHCHHGKNYVTQNKGARIDFVSRHNYGEIYDRIIPKYMEFANVVQRYNKQRKRKLEILLTETGPSTKPVPWLNDRYVAAWIVKQIDGFFDLAKDNGNEYLPAALCFWTKPVAINFGNQFGLFTFIGDRWAPNPKTIVKRPAFNAYQALNYLGDEVLEIEGASFGNYIHGILTRNTVKSYSLILYHLNEYDYYNADTTQYTVTVTLKNIPFKTFSRSQFRIDENNSNGYTFWKKSGMPLTSDEQIRKLQSNDDFTLVDERAISTSSDGSYSEAYSIQSNSVVLLLIEGQ